MTSVPHLVLAGQHSISLLCQQFSNKLPEGKRILCLNHHKKDSTLLNSNKEDFTKVTD